MWFDKVRRGFNQDSRICGPGDAESETVGLNAEVRGPIENDGVWEQPNSGRKTSEIGHPTNCAREIIDGDSWTSAEADPERVGARGIAQEINSSEAAATIERIRSDVSDAAWDCDAGQIGAIRKGIPSDANDTVGDRDIGQAGATRESRVPDAGNTVREGNTCQAGAF